MQVDFAELTIPDNFTPSGLQTFQQRLQRMEEWGYHSLVMPDTQSIWRELYVTMTVIALSTHRVRLWPAVTNPLTRHPAVAASAIASLDELSGGRALFNLGSGDSAVYNLGLKGAKLATMREYLVAIKELFARQEATYHGKTIRLMWPSRPVPVYVTAEGPKTLELAGELADGVLVGAGLQPEIVQDALDHIAIGARRAGRELRDIDVWWFVKWNLDDDKAAAIRQVRMALTASANHAFRFTLEGKMIPEAYKEPIRQLQAQYAFAEHESPGEHRHNAQLVEKFGLTDYLAERFSICGPPSEFHTKIAQLADLGITKLLMAHFGNNRDEKLHRFATDVMPHFRG